VMDAFTGKFRAWEKERKHWICPVRQRQDRNRRFAW